MHKGAPIIRKIFINELVKKNCCEVEKIKGLIIGCIVLDCKEKVKLIVKKNVSDENKKV